MKMLESKPYYSSRLGVNKLDERVKPGYECLKDYFSIAADEKIKNPWGLFTPEEFAQALSAGFSEQSVEQIAGFYRALMQCLSVIQLQIVEPGSVGLKAKLESGSPFKDVSTNLSLAFLQDPSVIVDGIHIETKESISEDKNELASGLSEYVRQLGVPDGIDQVSGAHYSVSIQAPRKSISESYPPIRVGKPYTALDRLRKPDLFDLDRLVDAIWGSVHALKEIQLKTNN